MRFWAKVRDDELYITFNPGDPGDWKLACPDDRERALAASLTDAEAAEIDAQITEIMNDPHAWDDYP